MWAIVGFAATWILIVMIYTPHHADPGQTGSQWCTIHVPATGGTSCIGAGSVAYTAPAADMFAVLGIAFGIWWLIDFVIVQAIGDASVGMLLLGLRVVRLDGSRPRLGRVLVRNVLLVVDLACCGLVGAVAMAFTKTRRRVGDLAAGTLVVRRSSAGPLLATGPTRPAPADVPVWDQDRGTYRVWDAAHQTWRFWDADGGRWR